MDRDDLMMQIADIEREIARLPEGTVTKKKIRDRDYYYHRVTRNGKRVETYVSFEIVEDLKNKIIRRKDLEKRLKELRSEYAAIVPGGNAVHESDFRTIVRYGRNLESQIAPVRKYKQRKCISILRDYVFGECNDKVLIVYGLRRTGKTTMIRQILNELPDGEFNRAAFIQITIHNTMADLDHDLRLLENKGYKYVFIDEVTLMEDFIEGAAIFADIYASSGMKIILSGTDSLGFAFTEMDQLYDRCIVLHTTFIPYREFEEVLGIEGIDNYIQYGGTMSIGGINYNSDIPFMNAGKAEEYIDTSIARNIQHSLKIYQHGGHFRSLLELYEKGELTNVINRVIESFNHRFTRSVIESAFMSHDLAMTAVNLRKDRMQPVDLNENIDLDKVTHGIKKMLDILNKEEQSIDIDESHLVQIKEYLTILDLISEIDLESLPSVKAKNTITVIAQPGLRYAQAGAIITNLLDDIKFRELSLMERRRILDRLLSEIKGRMMEEIILLESKIANPDKKVFKLQFAIGEFDMVVFDPAKMNCRIYEIKYSRERVPEQYRFLTDAEKCAMTVHDFGDIVEKIVIYRGDSTSAENGIRYVNAEEYLKSL
jgi:hypothetical protein